MTLGTFVFWTVLVSVLFIEVDIMFAIAFGSSLSEFSEDGYIYNLGANIGYSFLFLIMLGFIDLLVFMIPSIIVENAFDYCSKFLNCEFFTFLLKLNILILIGIIVYFSKRYCFFEIKNLLKLKDKYRGINNSIDKMERKIEDIDHDIKMAKRDKFPEDVILEMNKNKEELCNQYNSYLLEKQRILNTYTRLSTKIEEKGISTYNYGLK
jgi:hypothetical protein